MKNIVVGILAAAALASALSAQTPESVKKIESLLEEMERPATAKPNQKTPAPQPVSETSTPQKGIGEWLDLRDAAKEAGRGFDPDKALAEDESWIAEVEAPRRRKATAASKASLVSATRQTGAYSNPADGETVEPDFPESAVNPAGEKVIERPADAAETTVLAPQDVRLKQSLARIEAEFRVMRTILGVVED